MPRYNAVATGSTKTTNTAGGAAYTQTPKQQLATLVTTTRLKQTFYHSEPEIIQNILAVFDAIKDPRFVAQAAIYARHTAGMRSISHVLAVLLAVYISGTNYGRLFYEKLPRIPQDITETLALYKTIFGDVMIPHAMENGFARAFKKFSLHQLRKYHASNSQVSLIDAINLTHATGEHITAFKKLLKEAGTKGLSTAKEAVLSRAKKEGEVGAHTIDTMLSEGSIGYMAVIRSLREYKNVDNVDILVSAIVNQEKILGSKVYPYQILTAYIAALKEGLDNKILNALSQAIELALPNVRPLEGKTLIAIDVSGSMGGNAYDSALTKAALFAGALYKADTNAEIIAFDTNVQPLALNSRDSLSTITQQITQYTTGGGTDMSLVYRSIAQSKQIYERVVILTDSESWISDTQVAYRLAKNGNPNLKTYLVQFEGYGTSQFHQGDPSVYTFAGYNDKVMEMITNAKTINDLVLEIENIQL
jgi:60 kDa SS-A/Ro ribonucleoprotein